MIKSIIHAGGDSTRLREVFNGPKALVPIEGKPLLWFHLQPLLKSRLISEYIFTLRYLHEQIQEYIEKLKKELNISATSITEPKPLGRAGVIKLGIENGVIDTGSSYLMSNSDDLVSVDIKQLLNYASKAKRKGKSVVMVMARRAINPFGIGVTKNKVDIVELKEFCEKPELPFTRNHFASTGMMLFLPEAMKEFNNVSLDKPTHPENDIIPKLVKKNKVAVFLVDKWISINYASDYKNVLETGADRLLEFLTKF